MQLFDTGRTDPYTFQELKERLKAPDGLTGHGPGLPYDPDRARILALAARLDQSAVKLAEAQPPA